MTSLGRPLQWTIVGVATVLVSPAAADQTYLREADLPKVLFPESTNYAQQRLDLSDTEIKELVRILGRKVDGRTFNYLEVKKGDTPIGWIFVLDVIAQTLPITFAVGINKDSTLRDLEVMVYREPRGDEIRSPRFRRQFVGKRVRDPITLGKDIDAITGATISSRSATYAAKKGLALAEILRTRTPNK